MFSFTSNIRYSECDAEGRLSWVGLLDLFQDCSAFQSETLGVGVDYLKEKRRAWVLNYWQVRVNRFPAIAEEVEVSTVPYEIKGFFGLRNFILRSKEAGGADAADAGSETGSGAVGGVAGNGAVSGGAAVGAANGSTGVDGSEPVSALPAPPSAPPSLVKISSNASKAICTYLALFT